MFKAIDAIQNRAARILLILTMSVRHPLKMYPVCQVFPLAAESLPRHSTKVFITLHPPKHRTSLPPHAFPPRTGHPLRLPIPIRHHNIFCFIFLQLCLEMEWPSPRHCFNYLSITFYSKYVHVPSMLTCAFCNYVVQPTPYATPPVGSLRK